MATSEQVRRRRRPEDARAEILAAVRAGLEEAPLDALNVSTVMARTTLSRKSFYVYFADLGEALATLVAPLRAGADAEMERWRRADDPVAAGRLALAAAAQVYRDHGALLEVVLRAPTQDEAVLSARTALTAPLAEIAEQLLRANKSVPKKRAAIVARALATMNVHTLLDQAPGASDDELAALVDGLARIWERTVLGGKSGAKA